jgi:hypothetical protein
VPECANCELTWVLKEPEEPTAVAANVQGVSASDSKPGFATRFANGVEVATADEYTSTVSVTVGVTVVRIVVGTLEIA